MTERRDILPNNEKLIARALYVYAPHMKALCKRRLLAPFGVPEPPFSWLRFAGVFAPWLGEYQLSFLEMHSRGFEPSEMLKALPLDLSVGATV